MLEVADIVRLHGPAYLAEFGASLPATHTRALRDIAACRTPHFGGHVYQCDHCGQLRYAYHSCRNRHCPKCHGDQTARWLEQQRARLLPCAYFMVTFTLPASLRPLARGHSKIVYSLLMRTAAAALQTLAADPRFLGAQIGCLAVLHTWTRAMLYHPHVHLLVTAGGLSDDATSWISPKRPAFLVPVRALSRIFRAKMCAALNKAGLLEHAPPGVWKIPWVVHAQPAGRGQQVLDYLGRYLFRVAISNSRLEAFHHGNVTFRYRDNRTQQLRRVTLTGVEFLRRFLQHVLPRGFAKVRYYGLWSPSRRHQLDLARALLDQSLPLASTDPPSPPDAPTAPAPSLPLCPLCGVGALVVIGVLRPQRGPP